jgi:8-oxo-dGTP pyrophosphatase MutT (NUDIX family)
MYIKIYFNDKPLYLCDVIDETVQPYIHHDDAIFIDELNSHTIKTIIHEMEQEEIQAGVFFHADLQELAKAFFKKFTLIKAAGGLVTNEKEGKGKWDLPKGKLDKKEKPEDAAVREVEEETGLENVKLGGPLTITYHTYHEGSKHILKESEWYTMHVTGPQKLKPQEEEDITDIKWVKPSEIEPYLQKAFPLIRDVIVKFEMISTK